MNPPIGLQAIFSPSEKRGGLPFKHQAATDAMVSQIWHHINCHVTCLIFNKGGCSLPLRNKQAFKPQIWCIQEVNKYVSWYSDQAALEPLSIRQRCTAAQPEIFWGRKPWLVDASNTVTKSQNTALSVQPYGNKGKASGTSKVHSFFLPCSST